MIQRYRFLRRICSRTCRFCHRNAFIGNFGACAVCAAVCVFELYAGQVFQLFVQGVGEVFAVLFDYQVVARFEGYAAARTDFFGGFGMAGRCEAAAVGVRRNAPRGIVDGTCHLINCRQLAFFCICNTHLAGFFGICNRFYRACNRLHFAVCADSDCFIIGIDSNFVAVCRIDFQTFARVDLNAVFRGLDAV